MVQTLFPFANIAVLTFKWLEGLAAINWWVIDIAGESQDIYVSIQYVVKNIYCDISLFMIFLQGHDQIICGSCIVLFLRTSSIKKNLAPENV